MTSQITKIKGTDAQAVVLMNAGKEAAIVAKNMQQLGMKIPLYGSHGNARREFIDGAGDAAEGFHFAAGKVLVPESYGEGTPGFDVATDFIARYTAAYGKAPDTFAGHRTTPSISSPKRLADSMRVSHRGPSGRDREDERLCGYRRHVHLLGHGSQRSEREGSCHVPG